MGARAFGPALVAAALWSSPPASAEYEFNVLGTWGGAVNAVFIDEAVDPYIAYVGSGQRLVILDVTDPINIIELGSIDLGNTIMDLKVRDGYAYVCPATGPIYLCVVDVHDPSDPALVWQFDNVNHSAEVDLYDNGNALYVRDSIDLDAWDISDPENPQRLGEVLGAGVYSVTIVGDLMYVMYRYGPVELRIYNLSGDPGNPALLGSTQLPAPPFWWRPTGIAVEAGYACITGESDGSEPFVGGVAVVDVSNPEAPFYTGHYGDFWRILGRDCVAAIDASGGYAYVAEWIDGANPDIWDLTKGLVVLDVATDPANPTLVGTFKPHGTVWGVKVVGTRAYVMTEGEGLIILDISERGDPVRLGNWHSPAELRKTAKVGDLLYVTDEWNGVTILDVADPLRPTLVGVYQTSEASGRWGANWGIELRNDLAYLAAGFGHLELVNVADPANPTLIGTGEFLPRYRAIGLDLSGDIAHVGYGPPGGTDFRFVNFDVSDLQNINVVGDVWVGSPIYTIDVLTPDGIAFNARDSGGGGVLTNVDTSDPNDPFVIYSGWPGGVDLVREGNLLYIANECSDPNEGGLYIQDVSDPAHPSDVSHYPFNVGVGVAVQYDLAYVAGGLVADGRGLSLFDVSEPSAPVLLTEVQIPSAEWVLVDGRYAYVTGERVGLRILELEGFSPPGDLNGDGCVDQADLGILVADWGCTGGDCPGDCDDDGDTDQADLGVLLANWGEGC